MEVLTESTASWERACDDVASELLADCGIVAPPVDALDLASRLNLTIAYDGGQAGRGRLKRLAGQTAILVRPEERPERLHWTVAHEIGEAYAHRVFERRGVGPEEVPERGREQVANLLASRLLLPGEWFLRDARLFDADVLLLKQTYSTASHELILLNLLRLGELMLVTVFDHGRVTRRRGNGQLPPPPLLPAEREVWRRVHEAGAAIVREQDGVRVQGWPVHEAGWKRELLRTTAVGEGEGEIVTEIDEICEQSDYD
jgi:hypothetical protein